MHTYRCWAPNFDLPVEKIPANTGFEARETYARRHGILASDCVAHREYGMVRWG